MSTRTVIPSLIGKRRTDDDVITDVSAALDTHAYLTATGPGPTAVVRNNKARNKLLCTFIPDADSSTASHGHLCDCISWRARMHSRISTHCPYSGCTKTIARRNTQRSIVYNLKNKNNFTRGTSVIDRTRYLRVIYISRASNVELNKELACRQVSKSSADGNYRTTIISGYLRSILRIRERRRILIRNGDQGFELYARRGKGDRGQL